MKKRTRRNQALKSIDFLRGFIENRRSKWSKRSYFVPPVHTHADSGIMPGEWSLLVLLHKSLDLSLLTHRDSRCIAGPLGAIPVTYVDASTIFLDLWRAFAFFFFLFLFFFLFRRWLFSIGFLRATNRISGKEHVTSLDNYCVQFVRGNSLFHVFCLLFFNSEVERLCNLQNMDATSSRYVKRVKSKIERKLKKN